ncbi:hypothetical protein AX16_002167 [Volvariella volvacea WC 439]|nr:hypothetical protein AX16_002167 [Volvariella volvacea WC 439]
MAFSSVGRVKVAAHLFLFIVNIVVLALAAQINNFQEFFFVADLFPLGLSIVTLILLFAMLAMDFSLENSFTGRAPFEIGFFSVLSIFWLAFNAFSTSRWSQVPMNCGAIPDEFADVRGWCKNLQALKAFVWIEFVLVFAIVLFTIRYTLTQNTRGNKHIFRVALSRYRPNSLPRNSEFLQFERPMAQWRA